MPKRRYSLEEKEQQMRNRNILKNSNKKELDRESFLSPNDVKPVVMNMGTRRLVLKDQTISLLVKSPELYLCPLAFSLYRRWGSERERKELTNREKNEILNRYNNFTKDSLNIEKVKKKRLEIIGELGTRTALTGRINPFLSHLEYCLNCRELIISFQQVNEDKRRTELLEILAERCLMTHDIFQPNEIRFMEQIQKRVGKTLWDTRGYRLLKYLECENKDELIFVYERWKLWYLGIYKRFPLDFEEMENLNINDLRRDPKSE